MSEHPIAQPIDMLVVSQTPDNSESEVYRVGSDGTTRIEACIKSGMHSDIPYVRVWRGAVAVAEFCQHHVVGVYFKASA